VLLFCVLPVLNLYLYILFTLLSCFVLCFVSFRYVYYYFVFFVVVVVVVVLFSFN